MEMAAFPVDDFQDQTMFGIISDVIPVVAAGRIIRRFRGALFFLFSDERPIFVELDFLRVGGKSHQPVMDLVGVLASDQGQSVDDIFSDCVWVVMDLQECYQWGSI